MKRPLGITGEVAEFEVARLLGYELCEARQEGYDAVSPDGERRIQIKGRCLPGGGIRGRLSSIDLEKEWDQVAVVILDEEMEPVVIWEAERDAVEEALRRPGSRARNERGQLAVAQFKAIAEEVWRRDSS